MTSHLPSEEETKARGVSGDLQLHYLQCIDDNCERAYCVDRRTSRPKWHPASTAPRDGTEFLAVDRFGIFAVLRFHRCGEFIDSVSIFRGFTHWTPLPPGPKE